MSHYSRMDTRGRERESHSHYRRKDWDRDRDRSWNREKERPKSFFRGRGRDSDYSDRDDYRRYRPPSRDEKIVLIRRDRERDEDKKGRTPRESFKRKEIKPTNDICILRSPILKKIRDQRSKSREDQRENGKLPNSVSQNAESVIRSHTSHVETKSNAPVKEEIFHPIIPLVGVDRKETLSIPSVSTTPVIINSTKTPPVADRKEIGTKFIIPVKQETYHSTSTRSIDDKEDTKLNPVQKELVEKCFSNCKIRGDYDKIRRGCMLDIDTKPAFINARAKVMDITERFLQKARYHPHMDKAKLRENLKKSFELSKGFEAAVESLVNQILLPKIPSVVRPIIEAEVHRFLGLKTSSDNNSITGSDKQQLEPINKSADKNFQKTIGEIVQATTPSLSCLPPMNVIMDSEPISTSSKKARDQLLDSYDADKQLHEDIQEELNEESIPSLRPRFEVRFSVEPMKKAEEMSTDDYCQDMERQENDVSVENAKGNEEPTNLSAEASNTNIESGVMENNNDCVAVNTETTTIGATLGESFEDCKVSDIEIKVETSKLVVKESLQSISPIDDQTVKDSDDDMELEEESDEESPEFEKIGEVSPVRIDSLPDFEIQTCDMFVSQPMEQSCLNNGSIVKSNSTNNMTDAAKAKKPACVNRLAASDHTVLRIL